MSVAPNVPKPPVAGLALHEHDALPAGTRFGEFEIVRALGAGGFGIVYLAQDHSLERPVALKEYMPAALAARGAGAMISIRSSAFAETYAIGLRSFVNEARLLARFDHPSLVKVYRFWEDNGTAYMVMPYVQGRTLRDARRLLGAPPDEAWIRGVLDPMMDALELLHREGVFHRDVAPDNILLPPEGGPVLLDFGAARRVISDRTQSLTAILKPNYAPIEQYAEMESMRQGPWTDIYALGAVLHFLLFGVPPAPATARAVQPDARPVEQRTVPGVSPRFMSVVGWMLGVRPLERPQDIATVRAALDGKLPVPPRVRDEVTRPMVTPVPAAVFDATAVEADVAPTVRLAGRGQAEPRMPDPVPGAASKAMAETSPAGAASGVTGSRTLDDGATEPATPPPAPLRSAPPGTLPPSYVPPPWTPPAAAPPFVAQPAVRFQPVPPASGSTRARRFGGTIVAGLGTAAIAALVYWQGHREAGFPPVAVGAPAALAAAPGSTKLAAQLPAATPAAPASAEEHLAASVPAQEQISASTDPLEPAPVQAVPDVSPPPPPPAPPVQAVEPRAAVKRPPASRQARVARHVNPERASRYAAAGPANAREACADHSFLAFAMCVERQCDRPRFRDQPYCVRIQEAKRRHAGNY